MAISASAQHLVDIVVNDGKEYNARVDLARKAIDKSGYWVVPCNCASGWVRLTGNAAWDYERRFSGPGKVTFSVQTILEAAGALATYYEQHVKDMSANV